MNVTVKSLNDEGMENRGDKDIYQIQIDSSEYTFFDGEPEDNTLQRNFAFVFSIPRMLEKAFKAGKNGEEFNLKTTQVFDIE